MRIIGIAVEIPLNPKMRQVYLKLLLCFLLAISTTGQYNSANAFNNWLTGSQLNLGQTGLNGYGPASGVNDFGNYDQQYNDRLSRFGRIYYDGFEQYDQPLDASASAPSADSSTFIQTTVTQQPVKHTNIKEKIVSENVLPSVSKPQVFQRDQTYNSINNIVPYSDDNNNNVRPYTEPTGPPFGFQSTGDILSYRPEKLDLSKCGPKPISNPCTPSGPQYHPMSGSPNCYIHCAFGRFFVKPCPGDLVWNTRITNCDWPTIARTIDNDDYDTLPENNGQRDSDLFFDETVNKKYKYRSKYPFGRKKRSTVERKKRNIGALLGGYPDSMGRQSQMQYRGIFDAPNPYQSGPLHIPLTAYNLPGPVSFGGHVGFAGIPSQFAGQQSLFQTSNQAGVSAMPTGTPMNPVSQLPSSNSFIPQLPTANNLYAQARSNLHYDSIDTSSKPAVDERLVPAENTSSSDPSTVQSAQSTELSSTNVQAPSNVQEFFNAPYMNTFFPQQSIPMSNPFVVRTPIALEATLVPGPFYPYGPPHGGPFGGPMPATPKRSPKDYFKRFRSFSNQQTPFSFSAEHITSPFIQSGAQSFSIPRSNFGQAYQSAYTPYTGQLLNTGFSMGGQLSNNYMPFSGQQYPSVSPCSDYDMRTSRAPLSYGSSRHTQQTGLRRPSMGPLGDSFHLDINSADDASNEDEEPDVDEDSSPSTDDDVSEEVETSNKENNSEAKESSDKKDRRKRQYDFYGAGNGPASFVDAAESQPVESNHNPYKISSHYSSKKSRLNPNYLLTSSLAQLSPCIGKPPGSNTAHPTDDKKYIACLNTYYYAIMACPTGLVYHSATNRCDKRKNPGAICEREQPCMNDGQCYQTSSTTYKCICNGAWTGERCETQLSSCTNNPCGSGNECQSLRTSDYKQDYVCVCDENKSYGLSCGGNTERNPCLEGTSTSEQYHPFKFSREAFVQCNGDFLYVQPCAPGLIWNATEKVCDHIQIVTGHSTQNNDHVYTTPRLFDQTVIETQSNEQRQEHNNQEKLNIDQQRSADNQQNPPKFNRIKYISPTPANQHHQMAHGQPIPMDQSTSSTTILSMEASKNYETRPMYDDVYYEPPQISSAREKSFRRYQNLARPELQTYFTSEEYHH